MTLSCRLIHILIKNNNLRQKHYRFPRNFASLRIVKVYRLNLFQTNPTTDFVGRFITTSKKRVSEFSVDRSGLLGQVDEVNDESHNNNIYGATIEKKEPLSPLGTELLQLIQFKGPISLHDYISLCLNHTVHGYYQHKYEKIGTKGDFVTSPEISQLFGEMIAIWCLNAWQSLGQPNIIHLVELGPGNGTLMQDILRVSRKFPNFRKSVNIHFVELSQSMRLLQAKAIGVNATQLKFKKNDNIIHNVEDQKLIDNQYYYTDSNHIDQNHSFPVKWYSMISQLKQELTYNNNNNNNNVKFKKLEPEPVLIIGQEFLDAFPIHQFIYTKAGWRERLVDANNNNNNNNNNSKINDNNNNSKINDNNSSSLDDSKNNNAESEIDPNVTDAGLHFRIVISRLPTPAVK
eukprot:gene16378-22326_t